MPTIIASTYELIEKLGQGGGGVVYLARHLRLDKKVVLKADKRKITARPEVLRREVDALKNLSHTYIPQVYDFFVENDTVYTVIDYIEGESLNKPLKRKEKFTQPQVIKWAIQLLEALCYLHKPIHGNPPRGIVHSDIKPANVMLTPQGDVKLIDFNIALALGEENVVGLSAGYASPEHYGLDFSKDTPFTSDDYAQNTKDGAKSNNASQGEKSDAKNKDDLSKESSNDSVYESATVPMNDIDIDEDDKKETVVMSMNPSSVSSSKKIVVPDARSDIYSLGATLYHLLSGKRPAKLATDVVPLSTDENSKLIVNIISKAMNPDPDLRYQTAEEMLYDFTHLRENDPRTIKRKRVSRTLGAVLSVVMLGSVFTSFTGLKRMETIQKSLTLSEYSQNSLDKGDVDSAIKYALEALPAKRGLFTPDYTSQAKKALADSLGVYDLSDGFKAYHTVELPSETLKTVLSPDGKTGAAVYAFAVAVFDVESGNIKVELPTVKSALADVVFIDNNTIAYGGENGLTVYDLSSDKILWTGKPATHIAVSDDGQVIAGIYRDETYATVYDINGNEKAVISFNGNKQHIVENDTFADPMDNLMSLNSNGQYLAVSFENGSLIIYDTNSADNSVEIYGQTDFNTFEGDFCGQYFAFSATKNGTSDFSVIDLSTMEECLGLRTDSKIGVSVSDNTIYLSNQSTIVSIDPVSGEQAEAAYADSDIESFYVSAGNLIAATKKNEYLFYDSDADLTARYSAGQSKCDFVCVSGDYAVVAGRDTPIIKILKKKIYDEADVWNYDKSYEHTEARINEAGDRLMLFDYQKLRIYDKDGNIVGDVTMPDAEKIYDQQYCKKSGNLVVIYPDAFRLYSGTSGDLIYEETNLKSVMYTNYGVSTMDSSNNVKLIDFDTGEVVESGTAKGEYGAYCGMIVDSDFLNGSKVIGAGKTTNGYFFATAKDDICSVYDENGIELFNMPFTGDSEVFFTDGKIFLSPFHGTPTVYSLDDGKKLADLEQDSYLTYITPVGEYILSQYISASGDAYGILLDETTLEPLAYLPNVSDLYNNELIFDFYKGVLRKSPIYSIEDLMIIAEE